MAAMLANREPSRISANSAESEVENYESALYSSARGEYSIPKPLDPAHQIGGRTVSLMSQWL